MLIVKAAVHAKVSAEDKCEMFKYPMQRSMLDLLHYAPLFSAGSVDHFVVSQTKFWPLVYWQFLENFLGPLFD